MTLVHLVIGLALVEFFVFLNAVGRARDTYHVPAPATTGNEVFERYFRVQMNTLEQLIIFVPAILLFARYVHPLVAAALGLVFILGRWLYFRAYVKDPEAPRHRLPHRRRAQLDPAARRPHRRPHHPDPLPGRLLSFGRRAPPPRHDGDRHQRGGHDAQGHQAEVLLHERDVAEQVAAPDEQPSPTGCRRRSCSPGSAAYGMRPTPATKGAQVRMIGMKRDTRIAKPP